jgi:FkbM family methyltransferase
MDKVRPEPVRSFGGLIRTLRGAIHQTRPSEGQAPLSASTELPKGSPQGLIFDLGLHKGYDAEFYLKKGFHVVGVEAVPSLSELAASRLSAFAERLQVVNKALYHRSGETVSFFTVPDKDDWGSLSRGKAEKGVEESVEISVPTTTLSDLFDEFGVPYFIKCDLEGGDLIFLEQLRADARRPPFVSVEMNDGSEGAFLEACGYELGQIVNQWLNPFKSPPDPPREGLYAAAQFTGEMSGLFGRELDPQKWRPIAEIADIYGRWKALRDLDADLAPGWVDLHACTREALSRG